jgi:hypothetical protein
MAQKTRLKKKPFESFKFDRIEAFSLTEKYWLGPELYPYFFDSTKIEQTGKVLSKKQTESLSKLLNDTMSFMQPAARCFNPLMAFAFYKNDSLVALMPVSLKCNSIDSWGFDIPAALFNVVKGCTLCHGLSDNARKKLLQMCSDLGLQNCVDEIEKIEKE